MLTLEQFSELRKKGLSNEQISKFESQHLTPRNESKKEGFRESLIKSISPGKDELESRAGTKLPDRSAIQDLIGLATGMTGGLVQSGLEVATPLKNIPRGSTGGQVVGSLMPGGVASRGALGAFKLAGGASKPIRAGIAAGATGGALFPQGSSNNIGDEFLKRGAGAGLGSVLGGASVPIVAAGQAIGKAVINSGVNALSRMPGLVNKTNQMFPGMRKIIQSESDKLQLEAEKLTAQVLQPGGKEAINDIMSRRKLPAVEQGAKAIKEVKTYDELVGVLKDTTDKAMTERNRIFAQYNKPIDASKSTDSFIKFVSDKKRFGQLKPSELKQYDEVFSAEAKYLKQNPKMDIVQAQERKEALQDLTKPLLEKQARSGLTGNEPARLQALNEVRKFYKNIIIDTLPKREASRVTILNSQYEGLRDASELAASLALQELNEVPKTLIQRIASSLSWSPQMTTGRMAVKKLAEGKHLKQSTREIQDMIARSELLKKLTTSSRKTKP